MSSAGQNSRPVSISERRASLAARQQQNRPTSKQDERQHRKVASTTIESTTKSRMLEQATLIQRHKNVQSTEAQPEYRSSNVNHHKPQLEPQHRKQETRWQPTATLLSPTTGQAPLASRISIPPQVKHAPTSLQGSSLAGKDLVSQEKAMIEDLLYALLGFEGQYIMFDSYDPFEEKSRLAGPAFRIAHGLDPSLRDLTQQVLITATQVAALEAFIEIMSREERGSVAHALAATIRKHQKDFMALVAQLETQYLTSHTFTLHQLSLHLRKSAHTISLLHALGQAILAENGITGPADEEPSDDDNEDDFENVLAALNGQVTSRRKSCIGGALLNLLGKRLQTLAGDPQAKELLTSLLTAASVPYIRMLNEWLHHGNVKDPHLEFMINETKSHNREKLAQDYTDDYWEKRYTIRQEHVPQQLSMMSDKVLLAGKYLNVVRECSSNESFTTDFNRDLSDPSTLPQDIYDINLLPSISTAYYHANAELMRLLLTTHHLAQRLRSLKYWFFLDHSDWFTHFLESTQPELKKTAKTANVDKLKTQFDIILHTPGSSAAEDMHGDDVRVLFAESALTKWLVRIVNVQGMDSDASALTNLYAPTSGSSSEEEGLKVHQVLTLDTTVPFPLSLIISRVTLTRYQVLFRYLLSIKYLEHQLVACWTEAGGIISARPNSQGLRGSDANVWRRKTGNVRVEQWKRRSWRLRSRMLIFVQQLLYYCTAEVIEPRWKKFMDSYSVSDEQKRPQSGTATSKDATASTTQPDRTVDELMQGHVDFLGSCLQECMLTNDKLLRINAKVTSTCAHFTSYAASFTRSLDRVAPAGSNDVNEDELGKLFNILTQYEQHFERHLKILLDALNYLAATENASFLLLCARLSIALEGGVNGRPSPGSAESIDAA